MINKLSLSTALAVATVGIGTLAQSAQAGVIVQPIGVSQILIGENNSTFDIGNTIDQNIEEKEGSYRIIGR